VKVTGLPVAADSTPGKRSFHAIQKRAH